MCACVFCVCPCVLCVCVCGVCVLVCLCVVCMCVVVLAVAKCILVGLVCYFQILYILPGFHPFTDNWKVMICKSYVSVQILTYQFFFKNNSNFCSRLCFV